jgi:hypothetical protein
VEVHYDATQEGAVIPGNWIPGAGDEAKTVSVKLVRKSGFWIRWPALSTDRELTMEERRFYEEAKKEDWCPKHPKELKFRRIGETNEYKEV